MLIQRLDAVRPIARKIKEAEQTLNRSLLALGELLAEIPAARAKLGNRIPLTVGLDATAELTEATRLALDSYRRVTKAHSLLAQDKNDIGLSATSWGADEECPRIFETPKGVDEKSNIVNMKIA